MVCGAARSLQVAMKISVYSRNLSGQKLLYPTVSAWRGCEQVKKKEKKTFYRRRVGSFYKRVKRACLGGMLYYSFNQTIRLWPWKSIGATKRLPTRRSDAVQLEDCGMQQVTNCVYRHAARKIHAKRTKQIKIKIIFTYDIKRVEICLYTAKKTNINGTKRFIWIKIKHCHEHKTETHSLTTFAELRLTQKHHKKLTDLRCNIPRLVL